MGCERAAGPISLPFEYLTGDTALGSVSKDDCKVESGNAPLVSRIRDTLKQSGKGFITDAQMGPESCQRSRQLGGLVVPSDSLSVFLCDLSASLL